MIAGVCSGLGHYFDMHTTLVRVAFVVFTLLGGAGVLAYLVLWFALDSGPPPQTNLEHSRQDEPDLEPRPSAGSETGALDVADVPSDTATEQSEITRPSQTE